MFSCVLYSTFFFYFSFSLSLIYSLSLSLPLSPSLSLSLPLSFSLSLSLSPSLSLSLSLSLPPSLSHTHTCTLSLFSSLNLPLLQGSCNFSNDWWGLSSFVRWAAPTCIWHKVWQTLDLASSDFLFILHLPRIHLIWYTTLLFLFSFHSLRFPLCLIL